MKQDVIVKRRLRIVFIVGVAAVLGMALLLSFLAEFILVEAGIIPKGWKENEMITGTIIWSCVCIILGSGLSAVASVLILKPMNVLVSGISRLAEGDYTSRLNIKKGNFIRPVTESVNHLAEELSKTEILRSDFVNSFSHEFKTPINSINGLISLMKKGNLSKEKQIEYLNVIEEETHRLSVMTTNILNLSKYENQGVLGDKVKFNVSEQIRMCILLLEKKWSNKDIKLFLDFEEYFIYGNEEMLNQVWINLIDNAIKFANDGGDLTIKINNVTDYVCFEFINSGSVIREEERERIFSKFYRSDDSHSKEGNGIGLSIVKKIVGLHKGYIEVNSENNTTCFKIFLPNE